MPFPPSLTDSNVFIRRYMLTWEADGCGSKVLMIFTPLLKNGLPARSSRARIIFSGKSRAQAYHKAFAAGFRDAEIEAQSKVGDIPNRWRNRW